MDALEILVSSLLLPVVLLLLYARWNYGTLEKLGIPVVNPHFLLGSTFSTRFKPVGLRDIEWFREYGPVFGVYEGRTPTIYVCDPDLIRLIMVKDATHFNAKGPVDFGDTLLNEMPDYLPYPKWKIVRGFTSPAFSSAKLRLMNYPMRDALVTWGVQFKDRIHSAGGTLHGCPLDEVLFDALTDLTLKSLFSIHDTSDRFPQLLRKLANPEGLKYPTLKALSATFPALDYVLPPTLLSPSPAHEFTRIMESVMLTRRAPNSPPDIVDLLIDQLGKLETEPYVRAGVTRNTILFQAFNIFFSGQDESALLISALVFHTLQNDHIRQKLEAEITSLFDNVPKDEFPPRERLVEAKYLEACILESLRLYTFYDAERRCTKSWHCQKYDFTIPEGQTVMFPLWAINRNPEYFTDPDTFNPDRFMPGNAEGVHQYAFLSFGHGPRHCTGKQLALEVIRLATAFLFNNFKFEFCDKSRLNFHAGGPWVFIPHDPICFDISVK